MSEDPLIAIHEELRDLELLWREWLPRRPLWPKVGDRIRYLVEGPAKGHTGTVTGFRSMPRFPEIGEIPEVRLDTGMPGVIPQPTDWEPEGLRDAMSRIAQLRRLAEGMEE